MYLKIIQRETHRLRFPLTVTPVARQLRGGCAPRTTQRGARSMGLPEPARGYLTGVANNPRSGWLEYFGCAPRKRTEPASRVAS